MCGIAGFVGSGDKEVLSQMISQMLYRGPDHTGLWYKGTVGFAHARLSVIDTSSKGHQPMHSTDGTVSITFNGEIYNFRELRHELQQRGDTFISKSDTEVIIKLYDAFGVRAFNKLEGMFAFGLYDANADTLFLVRDRFGEKPLYWTCQQGTLTFASEPKALFKHPAVSKQLNPEGVVSYFTYDAPLTPTSIFKYVHKLEAGTYLKYARGITTKHVFWKPKYTYLDIEFTEAQSRLDEVLSKSVSLQLTADVPVGVLLSGGLDSSIVTYYAKQHSTQPVHTFSLGFKDSSYDESAYARSAAHFLGTVHHETIVNATDIRHALEEIVKKLDEPISDPAIVPQYLLSKYAREHVTVVLGGEGGDELFGGYQTFTADRFLNLYNMLPRFIQHRIEHMVNVMPVSHKYFSFDFKAKQFLRGVHAPRKYVHQYWLESFSTIERRMLFRQQFHSYISQHPYQRLDEYALDMPNDIHMQASYFYLRTYLLDVILTKVDRASMYNSLEVRAPFLDISLAMYALRLPWSYKHRGTTGKYILRSLMKGKLPNIIVHRSKHGFGLPIGAWLKDEWKELLTDTLSPDRLRDSDIFEPAYVEQLMKEHISGTHNHRKKLWTLLMFQLWYDTWAAR